MVSRMFPATPKPVDRTPATRPARGLLPRRAAVLAFAGLFVLSVVTFIPTAAAASTTSWSCNPCGATIRSDGVAALTGTGVATSGSGAAICHSAVNGDIPPYLKIVKPDGSDYGYYASPGTASVTFDQSGIWTAKTIRYTGQNCVTEFTDSQATTCVDLVTPSGGWSIPPSYQQPGTIRFWFNGASSVTISASTPVDSTTPTCYAHSATNWMCQNNYETNALPPPCSFSQTSSVSVSTASNRNTVWLKVVDGVGNPQFYIVFIAFDKNNPTISGVQAQTSVCPATTSYGWCPNSISQMTASASDSGDSSGLTALSCSPGNPFTPPAGTSTWSCSVSDNVGRSASASQTYNVDTQAPATPSISVTACTSAGSNGWCKAVQKAIVTSNGDNGASGVVSTYYRIDGGSWQTYGGGATGVDLNLEGSHTVQGMVTDRAGWATSSSTLTYKFDKTNPTALVSAPASCQGSSWCQGAAIDFTSSDGQSGVASTSCLRGSTGISCSDHTETLTGQYAVSITVTDNAGLTASGSVNVNVDTSAPQVTVNAVCNGTERNGWCPASVSLTATINEVGSGVQSKSCSWSATCASGSRTTGGSYTESGSATDKVGLSGSDSKSFSIDAANPTIGITDPAAGTWHNGDFWVSFWVDDPSPGSGVERCEYRIESGVNSQDWSETWCDGLSVPVTSGSQVCSAEGANTCTVRVRVFDYAGRSTEATRAFGIDRTTPATAMTQNPAASASNWYNSDVQFTLTCSDNVGGSSCSGTPEYAIDGGAWQAGNPRVTSGGLHTVEYRSHDVAGNYEAVHTVQVNIDRLAPTTQITSPATGSTQPTTFSVSFADDDPTNGANPVASGIVSCQYRVTAIQAGVPTLDSGWQDRPCSGSVTVTASLFDLRGCRVVTGTPLTAECKIETQVTDNAGNIGTGSPVTVRIQ